MTLIYVVLFGFQFVLDKIFINENNCNNTFSKVFNGNLEADLIILGNSRAEAHYDVNIIAKATNYKAYNLGLSGTPLNVLKITWNAYINKNKLPRVIVLDLDYNVLGSANKIINKFQYLPYINKAEYISVSKSLNEYSLMDKYIPFYKYRGYSEEISYNLNKLSKKKACLNFDSGSIIRDKLWNEKEWRNFKKNRINEVADSKLFDSIYKNGIIELKSILDFCKKESIKVFMIWSPQYFEVQNFKNNQRHYVDSLLVSVSRQYNISYTNFSNDSLVYDKTNFYNHSHLNKKGAELFSKKVGHWINQSLIK